MTQHAVISRRGRWVLWAYFGGFLGLLYSPIVILIIFSFNNSNVPAFPIKGWTLKWYADFFANDALKHSLLTSAKVAALSSVIATVLAMMAAIALVRRRFRGRAAVSVILLSPLMIPYLVFGTGLLVTFHAMHVDLSMWTIVVGHVVIALPFALLILVPRLQKLDVRVAEAARDLGAGPWRAFRTITLPLMIPALVSAAIIAFTTSFDEFAIASFVAGDTTTFPIYLFSQLHYPSQLPQVIAVAVVVISVSLALVVFTEVGRGVAERRLDSSREGG